MKSIVISLISILSVSSFRLITNKAVRLSSFCTKSCLFNQEKQRFDLEWSKFGSKPISKKAENMLKEVLVRDGEYISGLFLPESRVQEVQRVCDTVGVNLEQGLSLRKQILVDKAMGSNSKLRRKEKHVLDSYKNGVSIKSLSKKFDFPSVAILRLVLMQRVRENFPNLREKDLKTIVKWLIRGGLEVFTEYQRDLLEKEKITIKKVKITNTLEKAQTMLEMQKLIELSTLLLNARDKKEITESKKLDQISYTENFIGEREFSSDWEVLLYDYLNQFNINYINEEKLRKDGNSNTPDVVFNDEVYIDGELIKWVDCKAFYGTSMSNQFFKSTEKQMKRYSEAFGGRGAIIYRLGFSYELERKLKSSAVLLDQGPLPRLDSIELETQ